MSGVEDMIKVYKQQGTIQWQFSTNLITTLLTIIVLAQ